MDKADKTVIFDQSHQTVTYQYNAARDINFDAVKNREDLIVQLDKLKVELARAVEGKAVDAEVATDVDYRLTKATQQAQRPEPDKKSIVSYLTEAQGLVQGVMTAAPALSGLVNALGQAVQHAQQIQF